MSGRRCGDLGERCKQSSACSSISRADHAAYAANMPGRAARPRPLHAQGPRLALPEPGSCDLNASDNMQGRLLNGVAPERVCCTPASGITQKFIHIEQHMEFRTPSDWIAPITDAFP
jgi:hypothetical protein